MSPEARTEQFMLRLAPSELKLLKKLADKTGLSAADFVRQLVRRETAKLRVNAWVRPAKETEPLKAPDGSHWYQLEQLRDISASDRVFRLLGSHGQEIDEYALVTQEWFKAPKSHRFVLAGSPRPWTLAAMYDREITLHFEND